MRTKRQQKDEWYVDRSALREQDSAFKQHKATKTHIKDYSMKHVVEVLWDMNQDSIDDRMLILRVDDKEVLLSHDELLRSVRFV